MRSPSLGQQARAEPLIESVRMLRTFLKRAFAGFPKAQISKHRSGIRIYALTIHRFTPDPVSVTDTFNSGNEALAWLGDHSDTDCILEASVWEGGQSLGDFCLWCSGEFASARIGEHRDHNASLLASTGAISHPISFKDDDGSLFTQSSELVLPRELAMEAFRAWLIDQQQPGILRWS